LACSTSKFVPQNFSTNYLNYDKVRIKLTINNEDHSFKGYIRTVKDTSICFRFLGPLGYDLGKGNFTDRFVYFDEVNNIKYSDFQQQIENAAGIFINKQIIFDILTGNVDSLKSNIVSLNKGIVKIVKADMTYLELYHTISNRTLNFKYKYVNKLPSQINILSKGISNKFELQFEIIEISGIKKNCTF
jgi:hypothetical protein